MQGKVPTVGGFGDFGGSGALEAAALKLLRGLAAKRFHMVPVRKETQTSQPMSK